jgi:predicted O-methyltransferase YrrM
MGPVLEEILRTGFADGRSVPLGETSVPPAVGEFLQRLIRQVKPHVSLEVGLAWGISTLFIREALDPHSHHIVIDPYQHQNYHGIGLANLSRAGYEVEFHEAPSQVVLPRLWAEGRTVDFAFLDGRHTFDHVLVDFFYIDKLLRVGGVVALDDADWPGVRKVCRFVVTNRAYRLYGAVEPTYHDSALARALRLVPGLRRHLKPESVEPDIALGLPNSRCLAFVKDSDDTRYDGRPDRHREY